MDYTKVTLKQILSQSEKLHKLAKLDEEQIQEIFRNDSEEKVTNFTELEYRYDAPLYQKMIFRFRNCQNSPCGMIYQCDPVNQGYITRHFGFYQGSKDLISFFAWIKNSLGLYDIKNMESLFGQDIENLWRTKNEVDLFFAVNENLQRHLIKGYNAMISKYLAHIR